MKPKRYVKDFTRYESLAGWEKLTFGRQLKSWAEKYPSKIAVSAGSEEITYEELDEKADEMAAGLMALGIKKEDRVLVQLPNKISFVITLFALSRAGAIPIMALPAHRETELEGIIKLAEPVGYIVAERYLGYEYLPMANRLQAKFPDLRHVIVDGSQGGDLLLSQVGGEKREQPEVSSYSTAVLLLSGGTTGTPKLIPRTHTDYIYNARVSAQRCGLNESSIYLAALPVAHNFPLCCPGLFGVLDAGGKVVLSPNTSPDEILALITSEKVTITALVPAMVGVCMEMLKWDEAYDISTLQVLQVGGAMLEDTLADKIIAEWPCKLMQVFGTAEGLLCFTRLTDENAIVARCQGTPVSPADEIKLVDERGHEVKNGEYGELLARGPYTIDGYYRAEEVNAISFTADGFYRTGDRAMVTKEGNIRLGGRIREQINRAGEKIVPAEIESYLCRHPDIKEAVVVGVPDETLGDRSCAFLLTNEEAAMDLARVHHFLQALGVAPYKLPDQVETVNSWPFTSVGKIDKKALVWMASGAEGGMT